MKRRKFITFVFFFAVTLSVMILAYRQGISHTRGQLEDYENRLWALERKHGSNIQDYDLHEIQQATGNDDFLSDGFDRFADMERSLQDYDSERNKLFEEHQAAIAKIKDEYETAKIERRLNELERREFERRLDERWD